MKLLSEMAKDIINKKANSSCMHCGDKINKLNLAYIVPSNLISKTERNTIYYGYILCDEGLSIPPYVNAINNPETISFDYNNFDPNEILLILKKIELLL